MPVSEANPTAARRATPLPAAAREMSRRTMEIGQALLAANRLEEARQALETALLMQPASAEAWFSLANCYHLSGDFSRANEAYLRLIDLNAAHPEGHYNLGVNYLRQNQLEHAKAEFERALRLRPDYPDATNNLGVVLSLLASSPEQGAAHFHAVAGHSIEALYNVALLRQRQGDLREAKALYQRVLDGDPDHVEALNNLGNVQMDLGDPMSALTLYERALQRNPNHNQARWNLGLSLLALGAYRKGWPLYELRFAQPESRGLRSSLPRWAGEQDCSGLLIEAEQGLGDTLQFARFVPLAGADCVRGFVVQSPLVSLLRTNAGGGNTLEFGATAPFATHVIPLLSLPAATGSEAIPDRVPYLHGNSEKVEIWKEKLGRADRVKVGLAWMGNPKHRNDKRRSMPGALLKPLAAIDGASFFSLQVDQAPPFDKVVSLLDKSCDFSDTAAIVSQLDLVVTVDTSVAHLAGALGRPVWTLLPYAADWRWQTGRPDTPWYPTMRLFRQRREGDWENVIAGVRDALERVTQNTAP